MRRQIRIPTIIAIAFLCLLPVLGASAGAATDAAGKDSRVTIEGTVSGSLSPGSTTTVTLTIGHFPPRARPTEVVLEKIATDPGHRSCSTSIGGPDPDFSMPPVEIDEAHPTADGVVMATGHLTMTETGAVQDACRGAQLMLTFEAD